MAPVCDVSPRIEYRFSPSRPPDMASPGTSVKMSSMLWALMASTRSSVTALMDCAVSIRFVSRYVAVTMISSVTAAPRRSSSSASAGAAHPASNAAVTATVRKVLTGFSS